MWDIRFWLFFAVVVLMTGLIIAVKKLRFIDVQIIIMAAALALACDMLLCKQFGLYNWGRDEYRGWYSFWANLFIVPAWGFIFIKFLPKTIKRVIAYIFAWTALSTLFELFIARPLGIVFYHGWNIALYSTIGYFLFLICIYAYYRVMLRQYGRLQ
ncbi:hypothetical protein SAMN02745823_03619 [Sporobacter termitidis DSM 10068]|uniref:Uncharacterized protein n=1 Tax=Sporobacter termitidis DSM 10068 TaxID=1123282 RepID=A0A1M5ZEH3_9FIRM|nr:hypothetical protein [Sporobacter termitidis]SHI22655.1 hypothetical protein SAMN02745823_03619 [Sporobacter termitidis DSM 10068]